VPENFLELYNIAPQQNAPVVLNAFPSKLALARFGLLSVSGTIGEKGRISFIFCRENGGISHKQFGQFSKVTQIHP